MSVLTDAFEARYGAQRVIQWTNPEAPDATTKDSLRLAAAGADAEADFEIYSGMAFDSTNANGLLAIQTPVGVMGVRAHLLNYLDGGGGDKALKDFHQRLADLGKVTGRDRVSPGTNSRLQPTVEGASGTARPAFDTSAFNDLALDNPADGTDVTGGLD